MPSFIPIEKELQTRLVVLRGDICRNLMLNKSCEKEVCKYIHDTSICFHHWKFEKCKYGDECKKKHVNYTSKYDKNKVKKKLLEEKKETLREGVTGGVPGGVPDGIPEVVTGGAVAYTKGVKTRPYKQRNTESFVPMTRPVDARIVFDLAKTELTVQLTDRDILLVPNMFSDFGPNEIYNKLMDEIKNCGIPESELFKLWHGNDKIAGTHLIVDDRLKWKSKIPTFNMILDRIANYFKMDIKATRFNYYKDTSQWKAFHKDASAIDPRKAKIQNFTVAVSFGVTRDAAFERDTRDKTVISIPQADGVSYAFTNETNVIWRHGILQELPLKELGRISVIAWGWIDNVKTI